MARIGCSRRYIQLMCIVLVPSLIAYTYLSSWLSSPASRVRPVGSAEFIYVPAPQPGDECAKLQENIEMTIGVVAGDSQLAQWAAEELLRRWLHFMAVCICVRPFGDSFRTSAA